MAYTSGPAIRPDGLGLAAGATLLALSTIWLAAPNIVATLPKPTTITLYPVADPPPPPKPQSQPQRRQAATQAQRDTHITKVPPLVETPTEVSDTRQVTDPIGPIEPVAGSGTGGAGTVEITPPKPPLLVPPRIDPRYAASFQPDYPAGEIRLSREGIVVVRVLIGTDGRVKALEPVSATSDDFLAATRRRALASWRFQPATRDGVAYEEWKQMRVTFNLKDE